MPCGSSRSSNFNPTSFSLCFLSFLVISCHTIVSSYSESIGKLYDIVASLDVTFRSMGKLCPSDVGTSMIAFVLSCSFFRVSFGVLQ